MAASIGAAMVRIVFLSLPLLGGCITTLGHSFERTAGLARTPEAACMERLVRRVSGRSDTVHQHKERTNWIDGKLEESSDIYRVPLSGLDDFQAIQAGAGFSISISGNRRPFGRLLHGAGDYRLFWYYGGRNAGHLADVRRMAEAIEQGLVDECGGALAGPVRERQATDRALGFNPI